MLQKIKCFFGFHDWKFIKESKGTFFMMDVQSGYKGPSYEKRFNLYQCQCCRLIEKVEVEYEN